MTPYSEIYNQFLRAVSDYDILEEGQDIAYSDMAHYLKQSIGGLEDMMLNADEEGIDLSDRDSYDIRDMVHEYEEVDEDGNVITPPSDHEPGFHVDLPQSVINMIVTGMQYYWLRPRLLNTENMHNVLNTRDFSQYAPHNLLFRLRELTSDIDKQWRREKREYIQRHTDIAHLEDLTNG